MVLSAEALRTGTVRVARERVRISKRIVETTRTVEVPVRVEQLVVVHEPLGPDDPVPDVDPTAPVEELVVVLHEEVPEVTLRVHPVELVRIGIDTVPGEVVVEADVRSEEVEVDERPARGN
ncbi:DUF2382 domain-containing protein [Kineococcus endophyticus]|uniref:DUF2382 domain-containing protein n=1 Tax=Kineococcus endophyticus TaxID=1181883 RepID=A0ABV3P6W9_9ACTN